MEKVVIKATRREASRKKTKYLRQEGILPAVVYGRKFAPVAISLDLKDITKMLKTTSSSTLFTIELDGEEIPALIRESQRDIIFAHFTHMDFLAVSMDEKVRTSVSITLIGVAPAVEDFGAIISTGLDVIDLEALPGDIPPNFIADISVIENIGNSIAVRDLEIPEGVEIFNDLSDMVAIATAPSMAEEEEEEEGLEEGEFELDEDGNEPEVIAKGKEDEDED